jgi:hypothetical protein
MRTLMILCLLIIAFTSGCQNTIKKPIKTSDYKQIRINEYKRCLSFFDEGLISHFPKELPDTCGFSTNVLINDTLKLIGFDVRNLILMKHCQSIGYLKLKNNFDKLSKAVYLANETNLLLLFSYSDRDSIDGKLYEDLETPEKRLLAKHNVTITKSLPVPLFDIDYYKGNTKCGLSEDFKLYVLDAKPGKYLPDKYLADCDCLPEKWKHGYSKGVALSDKKRTVVYWIAVW